MPIADPYARKLPTLRTYLRAFRKITNPKKWGGGFTKLRLQDDPKILNPALPQLRTRGGKYIVGDGIDFHPLIWKL